MYKGYYLMLSTGEKKYELAWIERDPNYLIRVLSAGSDIEAMYRIEYQDRVRSVKESEIEAMLYRTSHGYSCIGRNKSMINLPGFWANLPYNPSN